MNFAPGYLLYRSLFRFSDFFHHWYVDGSKVFFHGLISALEKADKLFAVGINLRFFFRPIYGDYSVIGRFLGVIFRAVRIIIGTAFYLLLLAVFLPIYFLWLLIPASILYLIFNAFTS